MPADTLDHLVNLSAVERVIYDRLAKKKGRDVLITLLYRAAFDICDLDLPKSRDRQMRLGPYVARLNKKLEPHERIIPGEIKQTYRLETVSVGS